MKLGFRLDLGQVGHQLVLVRDQSLLENQPALDQCSGLDHEMFLKNLNPVLSRGYRLVVVNFVVGLNRDRLSTGVFRQIVIQILRSYPNLVLDQDRHLEVVAIVVDWNLDLLLTEVCRQIENQLNLDLDLNLEVEGIVEAVILDLVKFRCFLNCLTLVLCLIHRLVVVRLEMDLTIGRVTDLSLAEAKMAV